MSTDDNGGSATSKRIARSKRLAFNAKGEDVNDLTEAVSAAYVVLGDADAEGKRPEIYRLEYVPTATTPYGRAAEIFGFHTHAGNHANTGWNTLMLAAEDMPAHMAEYAQMIEEGGWTNRTSDGTAGAGVYIEAYARIRSRADGLELDEVREKVRAAWTDKWTEEQKDALKKDNTVKAEVAAIRAERAAAKIKDTDEVSSLPAL